MGTNMKVQVNEANVGDSAASGVGWGPRRVEARFNPSRPAPIDRPARILVVEDDAGIRQLLIVYLKHSDFDVAGACDGQEAIHIIPEFCPDLIVLDIMMYPVDGWAVLHWLDANYAAPVPVLVLTALHQLGEQVHGFEEGAIDYIPKPTQPRIIIERIRKILALSVEQRAVLQRKRTEERRKMLEQLSAPQPDEFVY